MAHGQVRTEEGPARAAGSPAHAPERFRFGPFVLDVACWTLERAGVPVAVQPKALDLLVHLIRHRDRVVGHDELVDTLWPDVVVSEASLSKAVRGARRAVGDDAHRQEWIQTLRGRGFRFVAVAEDVPAVEPCASSGSRFVGRQDALESVSAAIFRAKAGSGGLILLEGEAGMGKTRTAHEALQVARGLGVRGVRTWCEPLTSGPDLAPWLRALRRLAEAADPGALETWTRGLGDGLGDLASLVPVLGGAQRPEPRRLMDPQQARFRLLETAQVLVRRAAQETPTLVLLDDLHWADAASLTLLGALARDASELPLSLIGCFRDGLPGAHPLHAMRRIPGTVVQRLDGLGGDDVAHLVRDVLGDVPDPVVEEIHTASGGNPLFVVELTRVRAETPEAEPVALPVTLCQPLCGPLASLAAPCRRELEVAAVAGVDTEIALISRVVGRPVAEVVADFHTPACARMVEIEGGIVHFRHALFRDAVLEGVSEEARIATHARLGEALLLSRAPEGEAAWSSAAFHLCAGAPAGDPDRAAQTSLRAGERAAERLAYDEACAHFSRGLDAQALSLSPDAEVALALRLGHGEALMGLGDAAGARESLAAAIASAREQSDGHALARAALAWGGHLLSTQTGLHDPDLISLLEEAVKLLPESYDVLRVRSVVRLGIAYFWTDAPERAEPLIRYVEEVVDDPTVDPAARAYGLYGQRWLLCGPADLTRRSSESRELLRLAREAGDRELELAGHSCRFLDTFEQGDTAAAERELQAHESLASLLGVPRYRYRTLLYRGALATLKGRLGAAERCAQEALALGLESGESDAPSAAGGMLLLLRREQNRVPEVASAIASLVERYPAMRLWRVISTLLDVDLGRIESARAGLAELLPLYAGAPPKYHRLLALGLLADVAGLVEDEAAAEALYALLAPYLPRMLVSATGVAAWGALERVVGVLAAVLGDLSRAREHLEAALVLERAAGARGWAAWTELAWGDVVLRQSRGAPEGLRARAHAKAIAAELGMDRLLARAAEQERNGWSG